MKERSDESKLFLATNKVFKLIREEYDDKISNIVDNLKGQSAKERAVSLKLILEKLPRVEDITKPLCRMIDEASGTRQKCEYPLEQFLREKHPEIAGIQDIPNTQSPQLVLNEWRDELHKRYPGIKAALDRLPPSQSAALDALEILKKIKDLHGRELAKLESSPVEDDSLLSQDENDNLRGDTFEQNKSIGIISETTSKGFKSAFNKIDRIRLDLEVLKKEEILSYDNIDSVISGNEKPRFITNNFNLQATALCSIWHEEGYFKIKSREIAWTTFSRFFYALYQSKIISLNPKKLSAAYNDENDRIKNVKDELSGILE